MDKRGLTIDPSKELGAASSWSDEIESTRGPSPYATKAWSYWHDFDTESRVVPNLRPVSFVLDNGNVIITHLYPDDIYDAGLYSSSSYSVGTISFDENNESRSGFSVEETSAIINQVYASISVYDSKASEPGGVSPEEERYQENTPKGTLLGSIYYEIAGPSLMITEWSHENWHDSTPVRKAFESLMSEIPECVEIISVVTGHSPFWRSLGFRSPFKGSKMLVHKDHLHRVSQY